MLAYWDAGFNEIYRSKEPWLSRWYDESSLICVFWAGLYLIYIQNDEKVRATFKVP